MSILSGIIGSIKEILGIENSTPVNAAEKKDNTPVIKCENTGKNEDTFETSAEQNETEAPKRNLGQIKQSIEAKCRKYGIDYISLSKSVGEIAGVTREQFSALPEEKQEQILRIIENEIERFAEIKQKHGVSDQTNVSKVITLSAQNKYEAIEAGTFATVDEMEEKAGDVNAELGEDFKKVDVKERRARMDKLAKVEKEEFEQYLKEELSKLPESQRTEAEKKLREQYKYVQRVRFHETIAANDSETGLHAIAMLSAQDMAYGMHAVVETRCDRAEATRTADMANFEFTESLLASYYERGETPEQEVIKKYTTTNVSYKSANAVQQYQTDYNARRQAYENGEDVPPYMSEEFFTATAQGIGQGALNNINMTTDEKAEFLATWENDARQYGDYDIVTANVKKELEENPEYKDIANKLEKFQEETKPDKKDNNTEYNTESDKNSVEYSSVKVYNTEITQQQEFANNENVTTAKEKTTSSTKKVTNPILTWNKNEKYIAESIKENGVKKTIEKLGHIEVIEAILDNQSLKYLLPQLATVIKTYDLSSLKKITQDCSDAAFVYICGIVNSDFIQELKDNRGHLCYAATKQLEKMEENYATC